MRRKEFLWILMLFISATALAQPGQSGGDQVRGDRMNKIKEARQAFLRERLALTSEEAAAFFPVFWEYEAKIRAKRREAISGHLRGKNTAILDNLTEAEALKELMDKRRVRRELLEISLEAEDRFLQVIPAAKVLQLDAVEKAFRERLWERSRRGRGRG